MWRVVPLRTALNGRPRAGANWGENGVENLGRERFSTPDGPKWTAQREGGGGECMNRDIRYLGTLQTALNGRPGT